MSETIMSDPSSNKCSIFRKFLWPIYGSETQKFLPISLLMFFSIFNYTILRDTKDTLIIPVVGPETLPFIKALILPLSIGVVFVYGRLVSRMSYDKIFYVTLSCFAFFFLIFYFLFFPQRDILLPDPDFVIKLQQQTPFFHHLLSLYRVWIYLFFYVFAELWGPVMIQLLFWQFANDITFVEESKRFYPMYALVGHLGMILAGFLDLMTGRVQEHFGRSGCDIILSVNTGMLMISTIVMIFLRYWITMKVLPSVTHPSLVISRNKKKKIKMSFFESIRQVIVSPYIGFILILILGYGISNNILSLVWKKQLQLAFPVYGDYQNFMGKFSIFTGFSTILLILFSKEILRIFNWYVAAMITPVVLFLTGGVLFAFIFFDQCLAPLTALVGLTPLTIAIIISTFQQVMSKGAKYAIFDPTKEMAYVPLNENLKTRGKAAVDIIGYSLSKASGGYIIGFFLLVSMTKDLLEIAPFLATVVMLLLIAWIFAIHALNKDYIRLSKLYQEKSI